jgi:hypothetical protein
VTRELYSQQFLFKNRQQCKHKNNNSQKKKFLILSLTPFFSILSLLFHISFIHLISLPSSFSISPRSFLSDVLNYLSLSPHSTFCSFQFLFSLSSFPHLNLTIILLLLHSLSPGTPEFPLSYTSPTPCGLWIL